MLGQIISDEKKKCINKLYKKYTFGPIYAVIDIPVYCLENFNKNQSVVPAQCNRGEGEG